VNFADPYTTTLDYKVAVTPIVADLDIGDEGNTANENIKDTFFMTYHVDSSTIPGTDIQMAMINIEDEEIDSTNQPIDPTVLDEYFNPPFFRP
jgi:hypothetical protein